ncbi:hypothetical protein Tcan_10274 [Toxocara canis]|uniref:Uncharacterized protein n=1 Tax=Toxocara canis TaxID=6265 RepID=A0A0B2UHZ6_TOXCA|nr:hypothetical protein Tcan_10274 [Toxocara canis]
MCDIFVGLCVFQSSQFRNYKNRCDEILQLFLICGLARLQNQLQCNSYLVLLRRRTSEQITSFRHCCFERDYRATQRLFFYRIHRRCTAFRNTCSTLWCSLFDGRQRTCQKNAASGALLLMCIDREGVTYHHTVCTKYAHMKLSFCPCSESVAY